jgi:plastocyanin
MKSRNLLIILAATALLSAGCGSSSNNNNPMNPSPTPTPSPTPNPGGSTSSVAIPGGASTLGADAYRPNPLNIATGTTVTWTNSDSVTHTSTSNNSTWNSGNIPPGGQFSFTFSTAGTFQYHCAIHPGMVGSVVVQ